MFSNGCRAPPWRQVYGDVCYLKVKPTDGEGFCVTATTEGYYINKVCVGVWVSERGCVYCAMTLGEERVSTYVGLMLYG